MAAIEVHRPRHPHRNYNYVDYYTNDLLWFVLGRMFSDSANHFTIIDSYSTHYQTNKGCTPGSETYGAYRHKGDPFLDDDPAQSGHKVWEKSSDLGEDDDWIVVECQTENPALAALGFTGLPKWQCKFQWNTRYTYLADVSDPTGVKYPKNHNAQYNSYARFAPYGGWDKETSLPDFNPVSPPSSGHVSTQNHRMPVSTGYPIMVFADGCAMLFVRTFSGEMNHIPFILGDVIPPSTIHMPNPRALYCAGGGNAGVDVDGFLAEDGAWTNGGYDYATTDYGSTHDGGVGFWNENEELVESAFMTPRQRSLIQKEGNRHGSLSEIDSIPYIVIPEKGEGARFALSYVRKGYGRGYMTVQNKNFLTGKHGYSAIFPWDGSSGTMR